MADVSPRLGMAIPEGSSGDDDYVLVKEHVADNLLLLEGGLGFYHVANFAALPVTGNFKGRLAWTDDTNTIYRYTGAVWEVFQDVDWQNFAAFDIRATSGDTLVVPGAGGSMSCSYKRLPGKECHVFGGYTSGGAGINGGIGNWKFKLPFTAANYVRAHSVGAGRCFSAGYAFWRAGPLVNPNDTIFYMDSVTSLTDTKSRTVCNTSDGATGNGGPMVPGIYTYQPSGSEITWDFVYRTV